LKRALISVYDKTGIETAARRLSDMGYEIVSSGGTARFIEERGIPVVKISEATKSPEMLGGRVKTLHPHIFGGILARHEDEQELKDLGITPISVVICNLYPFESVISKPEVTIEEAIENIDIGGVTLLRAAAKNFDRVAVIFDAADYDWVLKKMAENTLTEQDRRALATKAFMYTCRYDSLIANYLGSSGEEGELPSGLCIPLSKIADLRYGENPHQEGAVYAESGKPLELPFVQHQGKKLSYINIIDLESAYTIASSFTDPAAVIVKHTNPCGVAIGADPRQAYERALSTDPMSAFGGIIGFNREVTADAAKLITDSFKEVVIAPGFEKDALSQLAKKKNLRVIEISRDCEGVLEFRSFFGGWLVQKRDDHASNEDEWEVVSERTPTESEMAALKLGWKVVGFVKSNAIVLTSSTQTIGIGAGQMSRIDAAELSVKKAKQAGLTVRGSVLSSDAFFPFRDSIDFAAQQGITAVIEPGGSRRDKEVIEAANEHDIALIFAHRRHFRH
jgi:phosphoribosylaminoimidazolecarboxamide formyltransferase/IMP cyclohydrolase